MIGWLVLVAGAVAAPVVLGIHRHQKLKAAFDRMAMALGGSVERNRDGLWKTRGRIGDIPVVAEVQRGSRKGTHATQLNVKTDKPEMTLSNSDLERWVSGVPLEPDEVLQGPEAVPLAWLVLYLPEVEAALREIRVLGGNIEVMDGRIGGYLPPLTDALMERFCAAVVVVARAFAEVDLAETHWLRPVVRHRDPAVRRRALAVLVQVDPDSPLTKQATHAAMEDSDPWLRFLASPHHAPLDSWVALSLDGGAPVQLRRQALAALLHRQRPLRERLDLLAALATCLKTAPAPLVPHLAEVLAATGCLEPDVVAGRMSVLEHAQRRALLEGLADRDYDVEPLCIPELARPGEARLTAIDWLHHHGSILAVEALDAVPNSWDHAHTKARSAVVAIQERAGAKAIDGGLTVVEEVDPGQLSLAADRQGGLSETES